MSEMNIQDLQAQINQVNTKLDTLLEYVNSQRLKTEMIEDLVADVSIVGKDVFDTAVKELDNQDIVIDTDELKLLLFKLIKNIPNFRMMVDMFESVNDFVKDASPIAREVIIDLIKKLHELDEKGVLISLTNTMNHLSNPTLIKSLEHITGALSRVQPDEMLDNKSMFKLARELNSSEVRRSLAYTLRLVKEIAK